MLIDYGFWGTKPVGFDLGQLVVGDVQVGRRRAGTLARLEDLVTDAYVDGLRAQGYDALDRDGVQRAHALCMLLYSGLSTLPFEHLGQEPTPALHVVAAERAATARFVLDLVDATVPYR